MTDTNSKQKNIIKLEAWGVATLFVFGVIFFMWHRLGSSSGLEYPPFKKGFDKINLPFDYYKNYIIPVFIEFFVFTLGAFWVVNFYIVPRLVRKEHLVKNILLLILVFLTVGAADAITDRYTHADWFVPESGRDPYKLLISSFLSPIRTFVLFGVYSLLKYTGLYFISNSEAIETKYRFVQRDAINAFVAWVISMFVLIVFRAEMELTVGWGIVGPVAILIYCYSFYSLIPKSLPKKRALIRYGLKIALLLIIFLFPVFMLAVAATRSEDAATIITAFNLAFQLLITAPVSWLLFKHRLKGNQEVFVLQKELGRSNANVDSLRSQINPHFLFNALNTIYGTAIQENAERTSEGIQKLGDMMRFMLQENMQEKIALQRELEYLNNYISLQKLRTDTSPTINIETEIHEIQSTLQIAPMLLIPFVENAFKHGISFREPSHIKVTLGIKDDTVHFDVYNSKHLRQDSDPEKDKSGIGLENVKQRLKLLYPKQHELNIRETEKEFFIHLTIQLAT